VRRLKRGAVLTAFDATDRGFLAALRDESERVSLAEGESKSLDLRLRQ